MQGDSDLLGLDGSNVDVLTVSKVSQLIKSAIGDTFPFPVQVEGEISGAKMIGSHFYFSLREDKVVINAAFFGASSKLRELPKDGDHVVVNAKVATYEGRSQYQLLASRIAPAGLGAIMLKIEALRKKLKAEGLFEPSRKRKLPKYPKRIGIITARESAAWQDIQNRLRSRWYDSALLWHSRVQGDQAGVELIAAIKGLNALPAATRPQVIIIARGGGAIEDLQAFSLEEVVRAVAESKIPTVSGVGHESDHPLIDDVVDWRSPTPTAAVEEVLPKRTDLIEHIWQTQGLLLRAVRDFVGGEKQSWARLSTRLNAWLSGYRESCKRHSPLQQNLHASASAAIRARKNDTQKSHNELLRSWSGSLIGIRQELSILQQRLGAYSFEKTLERGFILAFAESGEPMFDADAPEKDQILRLRFRKGGARMVKVID